MVAFIARDREHVDRVYKLAMANGAQAEGPPGPRGSGFYAGYFNELNEIMK